MNKVDLNRKIQLLEEQISALLVINRDLTHCECVKCAEIRKQKTIKMMEPYTRLQAMLNAIGDTYY